MKQTEALESSNGIYQKLEAFIRKYYTNELIRGVVLLHRSRLVVFFSRFLLNIFVEANGSIVLRLCRCRELRFIVFPIFKLLKQRELITEASIIIGSHLLMSMIV
jgi:hypothetical protein